MSILIWPALGFAPCRRLLREGCAGVLLVLALSCAVAQPNDVDATLDSLRQQIDATQHALQAPDTATDTGLRQLRATAQAAQTQSAVIAARLAPQLTDLEARLAELGTLAPGAKEDADVASQRASLTKGRAALDGQVKLARLLSVEGEQLANQIWTLRRSQFQARLGERTNSILAAPFWSELSGDLPSGARRLSELGNELGASARATPWWVWLGAMGLLGAVGWGLVWLQRRLLAWLTTRAPAGRMRRSVHAAAVVLLTTLAVGAVARTGLTALTWSRALPADMDALIAGLAGMCWFGGFMLGLGNALIAAQRPSWRLLPLPDTVAASARWFPATLSVVTVLSWFAERLAGFVEGSLSLTVGTNCLVALALGLTVVLWMMRAERLWHRDLLREGAKARPLVMALFAGLNWFVLVVAVTSLLAGYVAFGSFAVKQVVWCSVVIAAAYLLNTLIDDLLTAAFNTPRKGEAVPAGAAAGQTAAVRATAQGAVLVSGVLRLIVLLVALMLVLAPFGEGPAELMRRGGRWQEGLAVGEVRLLPASVLQALLVLVLGLVAVRWLRRWFAERYLPTTTLDPGMQASTASLVGYLGVVVAVALAMSALGIAFERIAWVASALSVGIGFGLQAVVQNFVSGLIMLAERPVKVGDWVSLGGIEGDIRRINARATEIQMGDRSTVIVPNSEFITKVVRNVTLADPLGLVQIKLPVPLGSDAVKVRELMLQAFEAEKEVLDTPAPSVLLDGIDAGKLMFSASGFVASPRVAGNVRSALLFDVLARLKEAGIVLSSPPTMLITAPAPPPAETG